MCINCFFVRTLSRRTFLSSRSTSNFSLSRDSWHSDDFKRSRALSSSFSTFLPKIARSSARLLYSSHSCVASDLAYIWKCANYDVQKKFWIQAEISKKKKNPAKAWIEQELDDEKRDVGMKWAAFKLINCLVELLSLEASLAQLGREAIDLPLEERRPAIFRAQELPQDENLEIVVLELLEEMIDGLVELGDLLSPAAPRVHHKRSAHDPRCSAQVLFVIILLRLLRRLGFPPPPPLLRHPPRALSRPAASQTTKIYPHHPLYNFVFFFT